MLRLHDMTLAARAIPLLNRQVRVPSSHPIFPRDSPKHLLVPLSESMRLRTLPQTFPNIADAYFFGDTKSNGRNNSFTIHLPAAALVPSREDRNGEFTGNTKERTKRILTALSRSKQQQSDENASSSTKMWLHCESLEQAFETIDVISSCSEASTAAVAAGICLPFPATTAASTALFKRQNEAELAGELENVIRAAESAKVPSSIWLVSSLSCPFGGPNAVDPIRAADCAVHFMHNLPCEHLFFDDTGAVTTQRHVEASVKTLLAVAGGRVDFDNVSVAMRTSLSLGSTGNPKLDAKALAPELMRVSYAVAKARGIGLRGGFCGAVPMSNSSASQDEQQQKTAPARKRDNIEVAADGTVKIGMMLRSTENDDVRKKAIASSKPCFPSLLQLHDWLVSVDDEQRNSDTSNVADAVRGMVSVDNERLQLESTMEAQERLLKREAEIAVNREVIIRAERIASNFNV